MAKKPLEEAPPPRRGPRPSVEVRDVLLRAAADLVAERGLSDIPLRMVAERAGVTPAMVGYYFDRNPSPGILPHRVILCPASCGSPAPKNIRIGAGCH